MSGWLDRAEKAQRQVDERLKSSLSGGRFARVIKMARKPTTDEYTKTVQISSIGLVLIGLAGFLIYLLWLQVPKLFELF